MDLETSLTDAYDYTMNELEKNLALAEVHAKQYGSDPAFCADCLRKHFIIMEGLAEENVNFVDDEDEKMKFQKVSAAMKDLKSKVKNMTDKVAFEMANKLRMVRKSLYSAPLVQEINLSSPINPDRKGLNTKENKNNIKVKNNMPIDVKNIGVLTGSQLVGYGVKEAGTYVDDAMGRAGAPSFEKPSTWIDIVGGLALAVAPNFVRVSPNVGLALTVIGTQRIADRVVSLAKEQLQPGAIRRVPMRIAARPALGGVIAGGNLVRVD